MAARWDRHRLAYATRVSDHVGRRRKPVTVPVRRLLAVAVALLAVGRVLTLPAPLRSAPRDGTLLSVRPGPVELGATGQSARLGDGTAYRPMIYINRDTSIGLAPTKDGGYLRVLRRTSAGQVTEVRRVSMLDHPQFDGFAVAGDDVVWAESTSPYESAVRTTLWRASWRTAARPTWVTSDTGDVNFYGSQFDLVVHGGQVSWVAVGGGSQPATQVRSVALDGGDVSIQRLTGEYALSAWPWAVSVGGGRGLPVQLRNLSTGATVRVATAAAEVTSCGPRWCLIGVLGDNALVRLDLAHPDGTQRRRVAGADATPTVRDATLLDQFVPLATDRGVGLTGGGLTNDGLTGDGLTGGGLVGDGSRRGGPIGGTTAAHGVDLSLYDIKRGLTYLLATGVSDVHARGGMLWWSTGDGDSLTWYAVDLSTML
jgi:hypothetical protein